MNGDVVELFRAGEYPQGNFTEKDLDGIAESYDPALHEAPLVIGHPENTAPAYGWVRRLFRKGATLMGELAQVAPEFREWVKRGLYKKRSVVLDRGIDPKGRWYLKNVGWLGAAAPQVKGLADVAFAASGSAVTVEFDETIQPKEERNMEAENKTDPAPKDGVKPDAAAEFAEKVSALNAENARLKRELRRKEIEARLEKLSAEGKVTPGMLKTGLASFMASLEGETAVEFAEGVKETAEGFMWKLLEAVPPLVKFGESLAGRAADVKGGVPAEFAEADPESLALYKKARAWQAEKKCGFAEAVAAVRRN